jgi:hypothetical protein
LKNISIKNIAELRAICIEKILEKIPGATLFIIGDAEYQLEKLKDDDAFAS